MLYKKVKLSFRYAKDRFDRTLLVAEDLDLVRLGCVFCTALGAMFEHNFLFRTKSFSYYPDAFIREGVFDPKTELPMKNYTLNDLGQNFFFEYDTGDGWDFDCKVYSKTEEIHDDQIAFLFGGKGQGIWEDNIGSLMEYLEGNISPGCDEEDEENGIFFPWNYSIEKFGDFDTAFDLEEEQQLFDDSIDFDILNYLDECHQNGLELEIEHEPAESMDEYFDDEYLEDDEQEMMDMFLRNQIHSSFMYSALMDIVNTQIEKLDYVGKKYTKLSKKYPDEYAKELIARAFLESLSDMVIKTKECKDKIEKIK